jgi:hypothetical protein
MPEKMHPNDYPKVQFMVVDDHMLRALESRADGARYSVSQVARRDLDRYYTLLERSVQRFPRAEALLLADAMNGLLLTPESAHLLWAEVADGIQGDGLDRTWDVDGPTLIARLRGLHPFAALATWDALERAWQLVARGEQDMEAALAAVGLLEREPDARTTQ